MARYQRNKKTPEGVLSKCRDMVALHLYEDAWQIASEFLSSKKRGWRQAHDELMALFVSLCIKLRKNPKDGFIQYRLICSTNHLDSLKTRLLDLVEQAQEKGEQEYRALEAKYADKDMEDVTVKAEYMKEQFTQPYLKYQWGAYKAVLDVLRNNQKLDDVYQGTVRRAMSYCVRLKRTNEFRKLCDVCRRHLKAILDHQSQQNKVEIHTPQMLGIYLHTRFDLLENATKLKMWHQAFLLIADIHGLKERAKTTLDPMLETNYYKKLTQIFMEADNVLLHAYSILRYYSLSRDTFERLKGGETKKKASAYYEVLTEAEINQIGKACVLATLSSPMTRCRSQSMGPPISTVDHKNKKMADKLHFFARPNRDDLMKQLYFEDLIADEENDHLFRASMMGDESALQESQTNDYDFKVLEHLLWKDTSPLKLCQHVAKCMKRIIDANPAPNDKKIYSLEKYKQSIEEATVRKLLMMVSKMYSSIEMSRLKNMFFEDWDERRIENLIIEMVEQKFLWCRMSHSNEMLYFRAPDRLERNFFMQNYFANLGHQMNTLYNKELSRKDHTSIRKNFFDHVRRNIHDDQQHIEVRGKASDKLAQTAEEKAKLLSSKERRKRNMIRREALEKRRADTERLQKMKQKQRSEQQRLEQDKKRAADAQALALKQIKRVQEAVGADVRRRVDGKTKIGILMKSDTKAVDAFMDSKAVESIAVDYLQNVKESQEQQKLEELTTFDYLVRASRKSEIPLMHAKYKKEAESKEDEVQGAFLAEVALKRQEHERLVKIKNLSINISAHTKFFLNRFENRRESEFQYAKHEQDEMKADHEKQQEEHRQRNSKKRKEQMEAAKLQFQKREAMQSSAVIPQQQQPAAPSPRASPRPATQAPSPRAAATSSMPRDPRTTQESPRRQPEPPVPSRAEATTGADSEQWRPVAPLKRSGRRKFVNSKKSTTKPEVQAKPGVHAGEVPPEPEKPTPLRRSIRPPPSNQPQSIRPQSIRPQSNRPSIRPPSTRSSIRPPSTRSSIRPQAPMRNPSIRPQSRNVRPQAGASPRAAPSPNSRIRPPSTNTAEAGQSQSRFRNPGRQSGGTSWRDRQAMRDQGEIDPKRRLQQPTRILSNKTPSRRFFDSRKGDE